MIQIMNVAYAVNHYIQIDNIVVGFVLKQICDNLKDKKMKEFKKLKTGVWSHIDKNGHIHIFTSEEFINLNRLHLWWSVVKNKYFRI